MVSLCTDSMALSESRSQLTFSAYTLSSYSCHALSCVQMDGCGTNGGSSGLRSSATLRRWTMIWWDQAATGSGSGHGHPALVDHGVGGNSLTYGKLFHLLIGNCFISCRLLMGNTSGRTPKYLKVSVTFVGTWLLLLCSLRSFTWYPLFQ